MCRTSTRFWTTRFATVSRYAHTHAHTHWGCGDSIVDGLMASYLLQEGEEAGQWEYVSSRSASVVLTSLQRAQRYQVQVRARSQAGYGTFGPAAVFNTLPDGTTQSLWALTKTQFWEKEDKWFGCCFSGAAQSQLVLTGVLVFLAILLLIAAIAVALYFHR